MYPRQPVPAALVRLALHQAGVVTREQALGCGLNRHAITRLGRGGNWTVLTRGVYLITGGSPDWWAWAWAGVLVGGDHARLGGRAAAHGWGWLAEEPEQITVLVPGAGSTPERPGPWQFVREQAGLRDRRSVGALSRTTVEDTALDLVGASEPADVVTWLSAAINSRRTSVTRLRCVAAARSRLRHRELVFRLLDDLDVGAQSALELAYLNDVERAHGLPTAERQAARRGTFADALYREFGLLVELDGRTGHVGEGHFRDMTRDNRATGDLLATLRYGHRDVIGSPCAVAAEVADNLIRRGWTGLPVRCSHCRRVA